MHRLTPNNTTPSTIKPLSTLYKPSPVIPPWPPPYKSPTSDLSTHGTTCFHEAHSIDNFSGDNERDTANTNNQPNHHPPRQSPHLNQHKSTTTPSSSPPITLPHLSSTSTLIEFFSTSTSHARSGAIRSILRESQSSRQNLKSPCQTSKILLVPYPSRSLVHYPQSFSPEAHRPTRIITTPPLNKDNNTNDSLYHPRQ